MDFYIWRDNIVTSLLGLADIEYQRLAWSGSISSADTTPEEMICTLMDDWAFKSFVDDNASHLNANQIRIINQLVSAIEKYQNESPNFDSHVETAISDSTWRMVVTSARTLYLALCPGD